MGIIIKRVLLVACIIVIVLVVFSFIPEPIDLTVETEIGKNYNNYTNQFYGAGECIDCYNGRIIFKGNQLFAKSIYQTDDTASVIHLADAPMQLTGQYIYYCQFGKLKQKSATTQELITIASRVKMFIALDHTVYFLSGDSYGCQLSMYNISTKDINTLCENINTIYYHNGHIYAIDVDGHLLRFNEDNTYVEAYSINIPQIPFVVQFSGDYLLYESFNRFYVINLITSETKCISLVDSVHANDQISYICDDENLYVSYQATDTNGSFVKKVVDDANGLWHINLHTQDKEKLCDKTFVNLFLFDADLLIGYDGAQWYRIDTKNGQTTKL